MVIADISGTVQQLKWLREVRASLCVLGSPLDFGVVVILFNKIVLLKMCCSFISNG